MNRLAPLALPLLAAAAIALTSPYAAAQSRSTRNTQPPPPFPGAKTPATFAPLPADHPLASLWNDPEFTRRLVGSYGFASDVEPRMTPEEHVLYRDKIVPLLRDDPAKAIAALEDLAKPNASAVFDFTLGNLHFQAENLTNAVKHFTTALAKFPDYRRAQKSLAFALVRDGKYSDAVKSLTRTVSLGGADGKVFGLLGFALLQQQRYASASAAYGQALVFEPDNLDFKLGSVKCAVATANYDHALALLDELLAQHPDRESLWTLQANIFIQKDQPARAAISLEILRRLGKATPQNLNLLGDLYMAQESPELALPAYLAALQADTGQNPARSLRPAQILVSRGAWTEARTLIAKIRTSPIPLSAEDELKVLKLESKAALADGKGPEAIVVLERIIERNPLDGEALLLAGDFYARNEQREKAEFRYDMASKIEGFEADAFVKHAQLLVQSRKYTPALELLRKAQKVKPRDNVGRYLDRVEQLARSNNTRS